MGYIRFKFIIFDKLPACNLIYVNYAYRDQEVSQ